jgi:TPR repeat protein
MMYFHGEGTNRDLATGSKWLRKASDQGFAPAQNQLAYAYEHGQGVPQDYLLAEKWYEAAAQRGLPEAQHNIGVLRARVSKLSTGVGDQRGPISNKRSSLPADTFANAK